MTGKNTVIIVFVLFFLVFCTLNSAAQNVQVTIQITNVTVNGGRVVGGIFLNADEFRRQIPSVSFNIESTSTVVSCVLSVPPGEYVISAFQDTDGNGNPNFNVLGIPREMIAITNFNGRGFPSQNYDRQKVPVNSTTPVITFGLYKIL